MWVLARGEEVKGVGVVVIDKRDEALVCFGWRADACRQPITARQKPQSRLSKHMGLASFSRAKMPGVKIAENGGYSGIK